MVEEHSWFKQIYTIVLLVLTLAWAVFCVWITWRAVDVKETLDILGSAGANALLGALISWNADVKQFWFRKRPGDSDVPPAK